MARTLEDIEQAIIDEKNAKTELDALDSPSSTAIWRLWVFIIASAVWALEKLWDLFKAEVQKIADTAIPGTPRWYVDRVKEFQLGDQLDVIDGVPRYAQIDEAKQIVDQAAVEELGSQVIIKTAKDEGNGLEPLSTDELDSLIAYVKDIKFAGTNTIVVSRPPDELKLFFDVYFDPLLNEADVTSDVEQAINTYITTLKFNGILSLTKLTDAIQAVEGVVDVVLNDAQVKKHFETDGDYVAIDRIHRAFSGYYKIDADFPLSDTITYTASDVQL